jgi:shikimate dehydrogenase
VAQTQKKNPGFLTRGITMQIDGKTQLYGIVGKPVSHSLSPAMHNAAFQHCGLNKVYLAFEVDDMARAMVGLRSLGVCGVSVTMPHKQTVIPLLDTIDPIAEKIGAVNTLLIKDEKVNGYNTDWIGAIQALEMTADLHSATVLVLGAGGSARAIGFGLKEKGVKVLVANRTLAKGQALARDLDCECYPLAEISHLQVDALVNTTSVGMAPNLDATPVPQAVLENIPAVMDIIYVPSETRLLREAREVGCKTVNGLYMLLYQGVAQFEIWTGCSAPVDLMREILFSRFESSS